MALDKEAKVRNIKYSVERYLNDNLGATYTFQWEGAPFESSGVTEWIQETVMIPGSGDYHRQVSDTQYGETKQPVINLNIFVNKEKTTYADRHYQIRDVVFEHLTIGSGVTLYDYAGGVTNVASQIMKVREIITDQSIPNDDFFQWNLSVAIDWLQKWT
jgi:hypothetical protein